MVMRKFPQIAIADALAHQAEHKNRRTAESGAVRRREEVDWTVGLSFRRLGTSAPESDRLKSDARHLRRQRPRAS
jgi:hypothetical protein